MKKVIGLLLLIGYLIGLKRVALSSEAATFDGIPRSGNITPFTSLFSELMHPVHSWQHKAYYFVGNTGLMVPFVIALFLLYPTIRITLLVGAALLLSVAVEVAQYTWCPGRTGDVDDVLLNTAGAAVVCVLLGRLQKRSASISPEQFS